MRFTELFAAALSACRVATQLLGVGYVPVVVPWSVTPSILQAWELRPKEANQCPACALAPALAVSTSDEVMILDSPLFGQIGPNNGPNNDTLLPLQLCTAPVCGRVAGKG